MMNSTTAGATIAALRELFAKYGLPNQVVSDNGPQFCSEEFRHFLKMNGIKQVLVAPYHAASNGAAERMVQSFKRALSASERKGQGTQHDLDRFLLSYRSTKHPTTGQTPASLFMGRELRTRLTLVKPSLETKATGDEASGTVLMEPESLDENLSEQLLRRRADGSLRFDRLWREYKVGFGDVMSEHWLGNEKIYHLTAQRDYELRVELGDVEGNEAFAIYKSFRIDNETMKYRLHVSGYCGNAGDSLSAHDGRFFTSRDQDNDIYNNNCARIHFGSAWWYDHCVLANLNGFYFTPGTVNHYGVCWYLWKRSFYSMKRAEMKIRPIKP
ncbi:ficolin-2-like [Diadema setosum]|uniref:ficolin-2-like n=1 Tax=Diadema setosum TaxID=31175 RepID=UPI003B3A74FA